MLANVKMTRLSTRLPTTTFRSVGTNLPWQSLKVQQIWAKTSLWIVAHGQSGKIAWNASRRPDRALEFLWTSMMLEARVSSRSWGTTTHCARCNSTHYGSVGESDSLNQPSLSRADQQGALLVVEKCSREYPTYGSSPFSILIGSIC